MGRSVVITTPLLTADEMAKRLRVGKKRAAAIREIVLKNSAKILSRSKTAASSREGETHEKVAN
jgi:hypothetical protein